jgi:Ca-activated chloride channel family protein
MSFAPPYFAEPRWLWLAMAAPVLLILLQRYSAWVRRRQLHQVVSPRFASGLTASHRPARRELKNLLLALGLSAMFLALARPQWGEQAEASRVIGQDILFVLDCSRSMAAADVAPSRLQRARLAILDFIAHHDLGRVGLVAFAGQAFLQCPLTFDHNAFRDALMAVDEKTIPIPGTDIGRALDEAFRAMNKSDPQKILVLVTDGEDLEKGGVRAAEALAKQGTVVFALGVGTAAGGEIRVVNEPGRTELLRDAKGEVVHSRLDEMTLRRIAQVTRGSYYALGPLGEGLARIRAAIAALGAPGNGAPARKLGIDRFHWPLAAATLLIAGESLIGTRRRKREIP